MRKTVQQLKPYQPEEPLADLKKRLNLAKLVRLSANENPYGTSVHVNELFKTWSLNSDNRYPDGQATKLRQAVSEFLSVAPNQLVFGCGLDEVISWINRTFLMENDAVLLSTPTFSEYQLNAQIEGAISIDVPVKDDGHIDFDGLIDAITPATKLVWLCNPNNPTGTYESVALIEQFMQQVPANILVVVDEAYIDYVTGVENSSALQLQKQFSNLVVLRTFSKAYGLANLRVGFGVFPLQLAQRMQAVRLPYNLNDVSQQAALVALQDQAFIQRTVAKTVSERRKWEAFLTNQKIPFFKSQTNFIFINLQQAKQVSKYLLQNGYLVRDGLRPDWLRITIGESADNLAVQNLLVKWINSAR